MSWLYGFYFCCFNQRGSFMQNLFGIQNSFLCCFFGCVNGLVKLLARNVERLLISEKGGCDLCSSFTVRKITSWERITKNTLGTHANTSAWRLTKKEIQESQRTKRGQTAHLEHDPVLFLRFLDHTHVAPHRGCAGPTTAPDDQRSHQDSLCGLCLWQWESPTLIRRVVLRVTHNTSLAGKNTV